MDEVGQCNVQQKVILQFGKVDKTLYNKNIRKINNLTTPATKNVQSRLQNMCPNLLKQRNSSTNLIFLMHS